MQIKVVPIFILILTTLACKPPLEGGSSLAQDGTIDPEQQRLTDELKTDIQAQLDADYESDPYKEVAVRLERKDLGKSYDTIMSRTDNYLKSKDATTEAVQLRNSLRGNKNSIALINAERRYLNRAKSNFKSIQENHPNPDKYDLRIQMYERASARRKSLLGLILGNISPSEFGGAP